jgi:predicted DNA-binding WGR domain protein
MKLLKQTTLHYREGASDKVYQVDLCEVGPGRGVVNFRYGRRGGSLKEGAKTVAPVSVAEAEKIFSDLVSSKIKKGYREAGEIEMPPPKPKLAFDASERERRLLERLATPPPPPSGPGGFLRRALSGAFSARPRRALERAIWRVGELKLKAAAPALVRLLGSGDPMRDYCIIWALGWCGDATVVSALGRIYGDPSAPDFLRRMACEALLKLSDEPTRAAFRRDMGERLPAPLRAALGAGAHAFAAAFDEYFSAGDVTRFAVLDLLYLIEGPEIRPTLLNFARRAPLRPPAFKFLRRWFKAAEYRRDAEMFGVIAYRFEMEPAMFHSSYKYVGFTDGAGRRSYIERAADLASPNAKIAYGVHTRAYLRRRVWRTLRRLALQEDPDYVKMAVGVLLPFTDDDARPPREREYHFQAGRGAYRKKRIVWDAFAGYYSFGHILFGAGLRYERSSASLAWRCAGKYRPGDPAPAAREESFPHLWESMPVGLLHLLSESRCLPVHEFAVKALRACHEFHARLDISAVVMMLGRPYPATVRFAFELALQRYDPQSPNIPLIEAVALCALPEARAQACHWINNLRGLSLKNAPFLEKLLFGDFAEIRVAIGVSLRSLDLSDIEAKMLTVRLIARLLNLAPTQAEIARDVCETLHSVFAPRLRAIGMEALRDLLAHPLAEVQEFAANILLDHEVGPERISFLTLGDVFQSPHANVRAAGFRLLDAHSNAALRAKLAWLVSLAHTAQEDVRNALRPTLRRLLNADGADHETVVADFVRCALAILLQPETPETNHSLLTQLLRDDAPAHWAQFLSDDDVRALLAAPSKCAQELGGAALLTSPNRFANEPTSALVALGSSEPFTVRQAAFAALRERLSRLRTDKAELADAVRILDSPWDDARATGFTFFREEFGAEHWDTVTIIGVCDAIRDDVQQFGKELLARHFSDENGPECLLKLSEHPSPGMQLFATNFLERFAADNLERLRHLVPYFLSVLSQVNRSRTAKHRIFSFLRAEALKSEVAAEVVAEILTRQSASASLADKSAALETLTLIGKRHPRIASPVRIRKAPLRTERAPRSNQDRHAF